MVQWVIDNPGYCAVLGAMGFVLLCAGVAMCAVALSGRISEDERRYYGEDE